MDSTATNANGVSMSFTNMLIFLVESPSWSKLLIGRPTLKAHGLLPEQNFRKKNQQPLMNSQFVQRQYTNLTFKLTSFVKPQGLNDKDHFWKVDSVSFYQEPRDQRDRQEKSQKLKGTNGSDEALMSAVQVKDEREVQVFKKEDDNQGKVFEVKQEVKR